MHYVNIRWRDNTNNEEYYVFKRYDTNDNFIEVIGEIRNDIGKDWIPSNRNIKIESLDRNDTKRWSAYEDYEVRLRIPRGQWIIGVEVHNPSGTPGTIKYEAVTVYDRMDVILSIGDSNAIGKADPGILSGYTSYSTTDLASPMGSSMVNTATYANNQITTSGWSTIEGGQNSDDGTFGFEVTFADWFERRSARPVGVLRYGFDQANLQNEFATFSDERIAFNEIIKQEVDSLMQDYVQARVRAVIFNLGIHDNPNDLATKIPEINNQIREAVGRKDIPIIYTSHNTKRIDSTTVIAELTSAVENSDNCYYINATNESNYPKLADGITFDGQANINLGYAYARLIIPLISGQLDVLDYNPGLWIDASEILQAEGESVSQLLDLGFYGNNLTRSQGVDATVTKVNGFPALSFKDSGYSTPNHPLKAGKTQDFVSTDFWVSFVVRPHYFAERGYLFAQFPATSGKNMRFLAHAPWDKGQVFFDCGDLVSHRVFINPGGKWPGFVDLKRPYLLEFLNSFTEGHQALYIDGQLMNERFDPEPLTIGDYVDIGKTRSLTQNFDLCETIWLQDYFPEEERYKITGYLAHKWGIDLPHTHPYFDFPPVGGSKTSATQWSLIDNPATGGTFSISNGPYVAGNLVTLSPNSFPGFGFEKWVLTDADGNDITSEYIQGNLLTMPNHDAFITVVFSSDSDNDSIPDTLDPLPNSGASHQANISGVTEFSINMVRISDGAFTQGHNAESGVYSNEVPAFSHTLSQEYYIQDTPVTQKQWRAIAEKTSGTELFIPSQPSTNNYNPNRPVETITLEQINKWLTKLNELEHASGNIPNEWEYTLPTEAEWEKAAKGGTDNKWPYGDVANASASNVRASSIGTTTDVKSYNPNPYGLYDMSGNVNEICLDLYIASYSRNNTDYSSNPKLDTFYLNGTQNIERGGGYDTPLNQAKAISRNVGTIGTPQCGFRLVLRPKKYAPATPSDIVGARRVFGTVYSTANDSDNDGGKDSVDMYPNDSNYIAVKNHTTISEKIAIRVSKTGKELTEVISPESGIKFSSPDLITRYSIHFLQDDETQYASLGRTLDEKYEKVPMQSSGSTTYGQSWMWPLYRSPKNLGEDYQVINRIAWEYAGTSEGGLQYKGVPRVYYAPKNATLNSVGGVPSINPSGLDQMPNEVSHAFTQVEDFEVGNQNPLYYNVPLEFYLFNWGTDYSTGLAGGSVIISDLYNQGLIVNTTQGDWGRFAYGSGRLANIDFINVFGYDIGNNGTDNYPHKNLESFYSESQKLYLYDLTTWDTSFDNIWIQYLSAGDYDQDGIPDDVDPHPATATSNTYDIIENRTIIPWTESFGNRGTDAEYVNSAFINAPQIQHETGTSVSTVNNFGYSSSTTEDGKKIAIGCPNLTNTDQSGTTRTSQGGVLIYNYDNSSYTQEALLRPHDTSASYTTNGQFGFSCYLSKNGNYLIAGAPRADRTGTDTGYACVYKLVAGSWQAHGNIVLPETETANDRYGSSVSISEDGNTITVGAIQQSGAAHGYTEIKKLNGANWELVQKIQTTGSTYNSAGTAVISKDASTIAIAYGKKESDVAKLQIFKKQDNGFYNSIALITPSYMDGTTEKYFWSYENIAISGDGKTFALGLGANIQNVTNGQYVGYVKTYRITATGSVEEFGTMLEGSAVNYNFGTSVSLNEDGTLIAVSAPRSNASTQGYFEVYAYDNNDWNLVDRNTGSGGEYYYAYRIAISGDGKITHATIANANSNTGRLNTLEISQETTYSNPGTESELKINPITGHLYYLQNIDWEAWDNYRYVKIVATTSTGVTELELTVLVLNEPDGGFF